MSSIIAEGARRKGAGETLDMGVSFVPKLKALGTDPETWQALIGTPTVTAYEVAGYPAAKVAKSGLTITNVQRNSSILMVNGKEVAVNNGVACTVAGGTAGETYMLAAVCSTATETNKEVGCRLIVE